MCVHIVNKLHTQNADAHIKWFGIIKEHHIVYIWRDSGCSLPLFERTKTHRIEDDMKTLQ